MILNHSLKAFYNIQVFSRDGVFLRETGFFPNLIPDIYYESYVGGTSLTNLQAFSYCALGTGTAVPANGDTTIVQGAPTRFTAVTDPLSGVSVTGNTITTTNVYLSAVGQYVGVFSEIGIFSQPSAGVLCSRTLIKAPISGIATTIAVAADEYVKVIYKLANTVSLTDSLASFVYNSVTYNCTLRPIQWLGGITSSPLTSTNPFTVPANSSDSANNGFGFYSALAIDSQTLATNVTSPTWTASSAINSALSLDPYVAGTKQRKVVYNLGLADGNGISGGIGSILCRSPAEPYPGFQIAFSPKFPKTNLNTLQAKIVHQFGR